MSNCNKELKYGVPASDQLLINEYYSVGYSYMFRHPRWAIEVIDHQKTIKRLNNFRPDFRIPEQFRLEPNDFRNSGYDRGHLVASADKDSELLENSETFLLSNMTAQKHELNAGPWEDLENLVREVDKLDSILEVYAMSGPIYLWDKAFEVITPHSGSHNTFPIPHAFFKSILTEDVKGQINLYSYIMPNIEKIDVNFQNNVCSTSEVERVTGMILWPALVGEKIQVLKNSIRQLSV